MGENMDVILESLTTAINKADAQLISLVLIMAGAYIIVYLILSLNRVKPGFRKFISALIMAIVGYYAYIEIFLTV
jgi:uncharacterized membrane protein